MTKSNQQALILTRILTGDIDGLTSRELFNQMESKEQGAFIGGVDGVSKSLCYLKTKSMVENGISKIVNGRTQLTWKLPVGKALPIIEAERDEDSCMTLSPSNDLDAPFIQIITALRAAQELAAPFLIERKEQKINTLERLGALMSDDIRLVLGQIVNDLHNLDEVA